jgi:hypothetical protein
MLISGILFTYCAQRKTEAYTPDWRPGPPVLVYKTRNDYREKVPVTLSADRKSVVSYPHITDLRDQASVLQLPTRLAKGYLLDNRGINDHVAFLSLSYQEYEALKETPSLDSLRSLVVDDDPLTELYYCGNRDYLVHPEAQLNGLILKNQLDSICRRLK